MHLTHHGGKNTVTGSCHELRYENHSILIDCGQFQGKDSKPLDIDFPVKHVQALIVTHAHIDHIGRIPWLLATGFKGSIICTPATAELIPLMLDDGLKLNLGMKEVSRERVLSLIKSRIFPVDYGKWHRIKGNNLYCRFQPAGHILGSAYVEIKLPNDKVVVFSGDLGPSNTPLLPDPAPPMRADYLVLESTYGNRNHESVAQRSGRLREIINRSLSDGGAIIIPAFSVGRTQELLFDIESLIYSSEIERNIPIILDSPMAERVTKSYRRYKKLWGREAKRKVADQRHPLAFEQCTVISDYRKHLAVVNRLASTGEPAIVVAASGMCEGGRVMAYLKELLPDFRTDIIFSGYQAEGTLGRMIQSGFEQIEIDGEAVRINAHIHTMSGYSAHADQQDLIKFVKGISKAPKEIHLIHGDDEPKRGLRSTLIKEGYARESVII
ncbi:MBL fold metallo-hydrolase [Vibrio hannami]|uniref:MBL fold metallo-hydrolase n=1 Tax=Vibrio hannami TaxID=2717094 RepID=UPI002410A5B3|nr:MBL fold metallo-hydrolase [Vibrio hannami]MDG3086945.1 MBL fold metallo-hydrolase [Vibrio hannami]